MIARLVPLLVSLMSRDLGAKVRSARRTGLLSVIVGLLLLTAYGAGVAGTTLVLAQAYGMVAAMFGLAIATLILAVAVLAAILLLNRNDRKRAQASPVAGALLAATVASLLPIILRSRLITGAATLGTIALLASVIGTDDGEDPTSPAA